MVGNGGVLAGRWWCVMNADRVIKRSMALAVVGVAVIAAVVSYEHASALVRQHGEFWPDLRRQSKLRRGIARDLYLENSSRQAGYVVIILGQWPAAPRR